ncbi:lipopolysaccharide biosynthesis protein [Flavobacterium sp. Fl-77]|uniref:Lipopolysaccharide biosynthesis protein n=1 Tax=Flavobacterium flavipigmentatum TaxID=2893884 RepID=A0AAJ2SFB0_9FLAO|nr:MULTISPECIES: lipopolysaccharide biosynthesis protein [unclassified Flavobacterium]MDX6181903.1 lipopolysaccharide biosynthesis protein [Flavobacterium sp. Fl-33]MDX6185063.1 lipopolysaccharide biosynthesis protein [Flavobacterium sp. Fl-77]UFH37173.1 lipopolysaccharide biosynthesis protein [Flavobacterium sp. F-70]
MYNNSLKSIAAKGIFWSAVDKFAVQIGQFVVSIILARILLPEDFGLIGMLAIFMALSQTFVESGLGVGLIQQQDRKEIDFSTVFLFNLVVSGFFYLLLFFSAPYISVFFNQPQLIDLIRVLGLGLFFNAIAIVQKTKLTIAFDFKSIAKSNVIAVVVGGLFGVVGAVKGYGVWALVIQSLTGTLASSLSLWFLASWSPSISFSKKSFNSLFGFGSKILMAGLYAQLLNNVYNICLGRFYPTASLGYYTRAKSFADLSAGTIVSVIQQATFPVLASVQNDKEKLVSIYKRMIRMSAFLIIPLMTLIALLAKPIIIVLLTEKWVSLIPLLQWMVFARIFLPMSAINMNLLNAVGRSDLFLKVDLSKLPLTIVAMIITIPLGVKAIIIGHVITSALSFVINAYLPGKLYGYGAVSQLKDMLPIFAATSVMAAVVFVLLSFTTDVMFQLFLGIIVGLMTYIFLCWLLKLVELTEVWELFLKWKKKVK